MKIIQVCPYNIDRAGGVQNHIKSLVRALDARGHETLVIAPGPAPDPPTPGVFYVGTQFATGWSGTRFETTWVGPGERRRVLEFIRDWNADVVHFHTIWVPAMPMMIFSGLDCATVATFHDTPPDTFGGRCWSNIYKWWSRWLLDRLDGAIAVSKAPTGYLRPSRKGVDPVILPPSVDYSAFRSVERDEAADTSGPFRLLFIGRLEPRKGVLTLLKAFAELVERSAAAGQAGSFHLTVAGAGELEGEVHEARKRLGRDLIEFVPAPPDDALPELMKNADIFVAPSPYGESFGIIVVEALSAGLPVVAAANNGYRTVLTGPGEQCLVPARDAAALAERIRHLASDQEARRDLSQWGRMHARQYDIEATVERFENVFHEAIARRGRKTGTVAS